MHEGRRAGGAEESANEVFACLALEMCTCSANRLHRLHFESSSRMLAAEFVGTAGFSGSRRISQSATSFPSTTSAWRCFTIVENNLATFFSNCHTFSTMQHSIKKSDLVSRFEGVGKQFERQLSQKPVSVSDGFPGFVPPTSLPAMASCNFQSMPSSHARGKSSAVAQFPPTLERDRLLELRIC